LRDDPDVPDETDMQRLSADDMMQLATEASGARLQFAAIAVLDGALDPDVAAGLLTARIQAIPRLRQRLLRVPRGCGRPIWVDDPDFDIRKHLRTVRCPPPADRAALLAVASRVITTRLPMARSPWTSALVTGLAGGRSALIIVLHHVLADGLAGLAILSRLVDGAAGSPGRPQVHRPSVAQLRADARASRRRAIRKLPALPGRLRQAVGELLSGGTGSAARCWVNRGPVGSRRALAVATADLAAVACVARKVGGTVNDVVLCAVTGALGESADARGEPLTELVVSIPISARPAASTAELGNRVGVLPVRVPTGGRSGNGCRRSWRSPVRARVPPRAPRPCCTARSSGRLPGSARSAPSSGTSGW